MSGAVAEKESGALRDWACGSGISGAGVDADERALAALRQYQTAVAMLASKRANKRVRKRELPARRAMTDIKQKGDQRKPSIRDASEAVELCPVRAPGARA